MPTRSTIYKKSVCRTRDSPGWLSIRVACSSSWKYSNRAPISSVISSNRSYRPKQLSVIAKSPKGRRETYSFFQQLLTGIFQTFSALFNTSPLLEHPIHLHINLVDPLHQLIAITQVLRDIGNVRTKVCFLAMRDRSIYQREPVVELLWCLDGLLRVQCMRGECRRWTCRTRQWCSRPWTLGAWEKFATLSLARCRWT
jgi:hypothetical protein